MKYIGIIFTLLLFCPFLLMAGEYNYPQHMTLDVAGYPQKVLIADLNSDNSLDIIIAGIDSLSVLLQQSNGSFSRTDYENNGGGIYCYDMCILDIDNDADPDLAFANETSEYWSFLSFMLNNGDGTFQPYVVPDSYPLMWPTDIDTGDFNGDGFIDLVTVSLLSSSVVVHFNTGTVNFDNTLYLPTNPYTSCVTSVDVDLNSKIDLAAATLSLNNLLIFRNNGDSTFADSVRYPSYYSSFSICAADFDNDSYPDLVTSIETGEYMGYMAVFLNDGTGGYPDMDTYYLRGGKSDEVIAARLDSDSYSDIAAISYPDQLLLFKNDQSGGFTLDTTYTVGNNVVSVAAGDIDNDGIVDLVTAASNDNSISLLLSSPVVSCCFMRGDVNRDQIIDISDMLFLVDYQFIPGSQAPVCPDEADIDGSGNIDIADILYFVGYQFVPGSPAPVGCP